MGSPALDYIPSGCTLFQYRDEPGVCDHCGRKLTGRQSRWCSPECAKVFQVNHYWQMARPAAITRDGNRCVKCGWAPGDIHAIVLPSGQLCLWSYAALSRGRPEENWLEVNHIVPLVGRGYTSGCVHHLDNLETLCHRCHVAVTKRQRVCRARTLKRKAPAGTTGALKLATFSR